MMSRAFNKSVGNGGLPGGFASCNFRMNEFTGAVMKGQLQKLDAICNGSAGQRPGRSARGSPTCPESSCGNRPTWKATWLAHFP